MSHNQSQEISFQGQVAIVTGGGGGMGLQHALLLAQRGAHVIVNDLFPAVADAAVKQIEQTGGKATAVAGDISDPEIAQKLITTATEQHGRIDIIIANAGIEIVKEFGNFSLSDFRKMMDVHVTGHWQLVNLAWPYMKKAGYGKVLLISSNSTFGMESNSAYATAKGALLAMSRCLALEGFRHGIYVNALSPIAITPMTRQVMKDPDTLAWMEKNVPASAISPVVAWLVHQDCSTHGEFVSCYGNSFGRIFSAETTGVHMNVDKWTPEVVRDNFDRIYSGSDYIIPKDPMELSTKLFEARAKALGEHS